MTTKLLPAFLAAALLAAVPAKADDLFIKEQKLTEYLAKDRLIGAKVTGADGKIIGDVEDLIIDTDDHIAGVIMGVGGFLGLGEKKVAVKPSALKFEATDGKINVQMAAATKDVLASAPAYQRVAPPKGIMERATSKLQELKDKSSVTAKDALDSAQKNAGPALEQAKEKANEAYEKAKSAAKDAMEKAKEAAKPSAPAEAPKP